MAAPGGALAAVVLTTPSALRSGPKLDSRNIPHPLDCWTGTAMGTAQRNPPTLLTVVPWRSGGRVMQAFAREQGEDCEQRAVPDCTSTVGGRDAPLQQCRLARPWRHGRAGSGIERPRAPRPRPPPATFHKHMQSPDCAGTARTSMGPSIATPTTIIGPVGLAWPKRRVAR